MVINGLCYYFGGFVELFVEDFVVVIVGDEADFKKKRWHIGVGIYIVIAERVVTEAFFYSAILLACQVADITDKISASVYSSPLGFLETHASIPLAFLSSAEFL